MDKVYVVTITELERNTNFIDTYTDVFADETKAKAKVDEYYNQALKVAPDHDGVDDAAQLVGVYGYVIYLNNGDIAKVKYVEKEIK